MNMQKKMGAEQSCTQAIFQATTDAAVLAIRDRNPNSNCGQACKNINITGVSGLKQPTFDWKVVEKNTRSCKLWGWGKNISLTNSYSKHHDKKYTSYWIG